MTNHLKLLLTTLLSIALSCSTVVSASELKKEKIKKKMPTAEELKMPTKGKGMNQNSKQRKLPSAKDLKMPTKGMNEPQRQTSGMNTNKGKMPTAKDLKLKKPSKLNSKESANKSGLDPKSLKVKKPVKKTNSKESG